jgi:hypothetical protein
MKSGPVPEFEPVGQEPGLLELFGLELVLDRAGEFTGGMTRGVESCTIRTPSSGRMIVPVTSGSRFVESPLTP